MPIYHFDIADRDGTYEDVEGVECENMDAAILLARQTLSGLARDALRLPGNDRIALQVRDGDEGPVSMVVTFEMIIAPPK